MVHRRRSHSRFVEEDVVVSETDEPNGIEHHFISDIEGRLNFLHNCMQQLGKRVVTYSKKENRYIIENGHRIVILGDMTDNGLYDNRVIEILCNTRKHEGNRLVMLGGNRDFNKTRFHPHSEMNFESMRYRLIYNDSAIGHKKSTWAEYLYKAVTEAKLNDGHTLGMNIIAKEAAAKMLELEKDMEIGKKVEDARIRDLLLLVFKKGGFSVSDYGWSEGKGKRNFTGFGKINEHQATVALMYLKWMLNDTMGCPVDRDKASLMFGEDKDKDARALKKNEEKHHSNPHCSFEFHRIELEKKLGYSLTDYDVMEEGFLKPITEGGYYYTFLMACDVAYFDEEMGILAFHGGITRKSLFIEGEDYGSIAHWVHGINEYYKDQYQRLWDEKENPRLPPICRGITLHGMGTMSDKGLLKLRTILDYNELHGDSYEWTKEERSIIELKMKRDHEATTIEAFQVERNNTIVPEVDDTIAEFLESQGIRFVVYGHQPFGSSSVGSLFLVERERDNIVFMNLDVTRAKDQRNLLCVGTIKPDGKYYVDANLDNNKKEKDIIHITKAYPLMQDGERTFCQMDAERDNGVEFILRLYRPSPFVAEMVVEG